MSNDIISDSSRFILLTKSNLLTYTGIERNANCTLTISITDGMILNDNDTTMEKEHVFVSLLVLINLVDFLYECQVLFPGGE